MATGFSRVFLPSERLTLVGGLGLLFGFIGVGLVARSDLSNLLSGGLIFPGFMLLAAVCVALGSVLTQRVESGISTEGMVAWSNAVGAVLLHGISASLPSESVTDVERTTGVILAVVYLAVFASVVGYFIYFDLLDRVGAIEINLVSYAAPVFAAVSGWVVLNESLDIVSIIGFVVIFVGFVLLKREAISSEIESIQLRNSSE